MKKILSLILVLALCFTLSLVSVSAHATDNGFDPYTPPVVDDSDEGGVAVGGIDLPMYNIDVFRDFDNASHATFRQYINPSSVDDDSFTYEPGAFVVDMMTNRMSTLDNDHSWVLFTLGTFTEARPFSALLPYEGGEAGEALYSGIFLLPDHSAVLGGEYYEGYSFPDEKVGLKVVFPGDITVSVPAGAEGSVTSVRLDILSDRLVPVLMSGETAVEDSGAYLELTGSGTPVWVDSEGSEIEAEYEYEEESGLYKVTLRSGCALAFKA